MEQIATKMGTEKQSAKKSITIYIGGHDPVKLSKTINIIEDLGIQTVRVLSPIMSPGWEGCRECHRLMAARALKDGCQTYIAMEQNVIPTLRYNQETIQDALRVVKSGMAQLVNLSCMPIPFTFRSPEYASVMRKRITRNDLTQCLVIRQEVMQKALALGEPIDVSLGKLGYQTHVVYPTPFQRDLTPSLASLDFNRSIGKLGRDFLFNPINYRNLEWIAQYDAVLLGVFLTLVAFLLIKYHKS